MSFQKSKIQPAFADLKAILSQTQLDNTSYQLLQTLIDRLGQYQNFITDEFKKVPAGESTVPGPPGPIGPQGPPGPGTGLHQATHQPGGTDYLVNNAWLDQANVFTQHQTINRNGADFRLIDPIQPADKKLWRISNNDQLFYILATNDAVSTNECTISFTRTGALEGALLNADSINRGTVNDARLSINVLKHPGGYPGGASSVLTGTGAFVPITTLPTSLHHTTHEPGGTDVIAKLVSGVKVTGPAYAIYFESTAQPADNRLWRFQEYGDGALRVEAVSDNTAIIQGSPFTLFREGSVNIGNNLTIFGAGGNAARKDVINHFTIAQRFSNTAGGTAYLLLEDITSPVDKKKWKIVNSNQQFNIWGVNDPDNTVLVAISINWAGELVGASLDASSLNRGTVPSARIGPPVAKTDVANTFGPSQSFSNAILANSNESQYNTGNGYVRMHFRDTSIAAGGQTYTLVNIGGTISIVPTDDAGQNPIGGSFIRSFSVERSGQVRIGSGGLFVDKLNQGGAGINYGTFVPTVTIRSNLAGCAAYTAAFLRVGDVVTVSGKMDVTQSAVGSQAWVSFTLPIAAPGLAAQGGHFCGGTVSSNNGDAGSVTGSTIGMDFQWKIVTSGTLGFFYTFTYHIL